MNKTMGVKSSFQLFWSKHSVVISIVILAIIALLVFLPNLGKLPLVDYDEGTYARVIHDTRVSGDISTLQYFGRPWFEKPPLYFWTAIASVTLFGENEFAMRLPAVIFSLLTLLFTFLIAKRLSNIKVAIGATLILLFSSLYRYYSAEIRVDTGVLMGMMAALYFFISGWKQPKFLLGVLPAIAVGFMMKDVVALLIIPIALVFAFFYREWSWLWSKYFWMGILPMAVVAIPWHLEQHLRFGNAFWSDYIGHHVVDRAVKGLGIGIEKATGNYWGYFQYLWMYAQPLWTIFIVFALIFLVYCLKKRKQQDPLILSSIITVVFFYYNLYVSSDSNYNLYFAHFPFHGDGFGWDFGSSI
jgi:4-amino-4-deoxy-L-arabinose transferase-like glycosyltransferase